MKTIQVATAEGHALSWLVAKCDGRSPSIHEYSKDKGSYFVLMQKGVHRTECNFSENWAQGGPVIQREGINLSVDYQDDALTDDMIAIGWKANLWNNSVPGTSGFLQWAYGSTPLVAAMRCFVASKLGKEAEVPEELA